MKKSSLILLWNILFGFSLASTMDIESHPNWWLVEDEKCGISYGDRIIGGVTAPLGAYPWIARIAYEKSPPLVDVLTIMFGCAGTLINQIYVLTAGHCLSNLPEGARPVSVRLGEHNILTDPDCQLNDCAEPVQDFQIAEIIVHERYESPEFINDIALIRLDKPVNYNDFVRPVCMIRNGLLDKNYVGETAEVAGWGIDDIETLSRSLDLQTLTIPIVEMNLCQRAYIDFAEVGANRQLCAGGQIGKDSCVGDSGGPLMQVNNLDEELKYYLIGIVSFGKRRCGATDAPAIYTKVAWYVDWILDHIH